MNRNIKIFGGLCSLVVVLIVLGLLFMQHLRLKERLKIQDDLAQSVLAVKGDTTQQQKQYLGERRGAYTGYLASRGSLWAQEDRHFILAAYIAQGVNGDLFCSMFVIPGVDHPEVYFEDENQQPIELANATFTISHGGGIHSGVNVLLRAKDPASKEGRDGSALSEEQIKRISKVRVREKGGKWSPTCRVFSSFEDAERYGGDGKIKE